MIGATLCTARPNKDKKKQPLRLRRKYRKRQTCSSGIRRARALKDSQGQGPRLVFWHGAKHDQIRPGPGHVANGDSIARFLIREKVDPTFPFFPFSFLFFFSRASCRYWDSLLLCFLEIAHSHRPRGSLELSRLRASYLLEISSLFYNNRAKLPVARPIVSHHLFV